jgi:hypothetical protein
MKIIFLCGSLEPGRDGVGDYTRRLAGELMRQGHVSALISLYDSYTNKEISDFQQIENTHVPVLRIPQVLGNEKRLVLVNSFVEKYQPDILSLQYVPYSYSLKGTPLSLGKLLSKIKTKSRWAVMIHEPYLGKFNFKVKEQLVRLLQVVSLLCIKTRLRPMIWHTTMPYYKKMLQTISINSNILGLFSNIPISNKKVNYSLPFAKSENDLVLLYFGTVPSVKHYPVFQKKIKEYLAITKRSIKIILCGRGGNNGLLFKQILESCDIDRVQTISLGEQTVEELSQLFLYADAGISRVPLRLVGKSGSALAMLEHGLPLWVPITERKDEFNLLSFRSELCCSNLIELKNIDKKKAINRITDIAEQLIAEFKK